MKMMNLRPHGFGLGNIRMVKRKDVEYMHLPEAFYSTLRVVFFLDKWHKKRYIMGGRFIGSGMGIRTISRRRLCLFSVKINTNEGVIREFVQYQKESNDLV